MNMKKRKKEENLRLSARIANADRERAARPRPFDWADCQTVCVRLRLESVRTSALRTRSRLSIVCLTVETTRKVKWGRLRLEASGRRPSFSRLACARTRKFLKLD